jgi:proteasome lid subunit RPN8/RPN11
MLTEQQKDEIKKLSIKAAPYEICGVVLKSVSGNAFHVCKNIAENPKNSFAISPFEIESIKQKGEVVALFHSHDEKSFSLADEFVSEKFKLPSIIYKIKEDEFETYEPKGIEPPIIGRPFIFGIFDCFTLVQDFYAIKYNIKIPDIKHPLRKVLNFNEEADQYENKNVIIEHFLNNSFVYADKPKTGDVLVIKLGKQPVAGHFAIFQEPDSIIHHLEDEDSERIPYAKYYKNHTKAILRHKSMV